MIAVDEALARVLALCPQLETEEIALADSAGHVLRAPVVSTRDQPPFASSVMDGYAVREGEVMEGARFTVIGEAPAGHAFDGVIAQGQAVRIFTGAPVPEGGSRVVIQEDVKRDGDIIEVQPGFDTKRYIRAQGNDFKIGDEVAAPRRLRPADLALIAAMNAGRVTVARKPVVAILTTGDELVMPGDDPAPDQIVSSNSFALKAIVEAAGAEARVLPIARDREDSLRTAFALAEGADLLVTLGGASVGDHDLVGPISQALGYKRDFYKIAMRPGKPLMAGSNGTTMMLGLPGNPVSAFVCAHIFLRPAIDAMLGLPPRGSAPLTAPLATPLAENGPRQHYMRAKLGPEGIEAFADQDSGLLSILNAANALIIRPVRDPARQTGETVEYLPLDSGPS